MIPFTAYDTTTETAITRAEIEIEQLMAIIVRLNDALDRRADTIDELRHEVELQMARAEVCEAHLRRAGEQQG